MIDRAFITRKELLELLKSEARKFDICKSIYIGPIKEKPIDTDGCNWLLHISGGEEYETKECVKSIKA